MVQFRCDSYPLSRKVAEKIGANGYASFSAVVGRAGVFPYEQGDGSIIRELRHPDDVFSSHSLITLRGVPLITEKDHMKCLNNNVPVNQVDEFTTLGVVLDRAARNSADEIEADIKVYRPETIQKIDSGEERQLSAGYTVDIVKESGEYKGQPYDQKQTNIIYGHVATVRRGRAGTAQFRIDSKAAVLLNETVNNCNNKQRGIIMKQREIPALEIGKGESSIRLDSLSIIDGEGVAELLAQRNTLINEYKKAQVRIDRAEAEKDILKGEKDKLEHALKNSVPIERLDAQVKERALLNEICSVMEIDMKGKSGEEIKREICLKDKPALNESRLDGDYLEAAFDILASDWEEKKNEHKVISNVENFMKKQTSNMGNTPIQYNLKT